MDNSKPVIIWDCDGTPNQTWIAQPSGFAGYYLITNSQNPAKCLSVGRKSLNSGAGLVIFDCKPSNDNEDQRWMVGGRHPSCGLFRNFNSGMLMALRGSEQYWSINVVQETDGAQVPPSYTTQSDAWWCGVPA
jgi:hypothetical protein